MRVRNLVRMPKVCRNSGSCCTGWRVCGSHALLLVALLPQRRLRQLLDVVHHTVQIPLGPTLYATPALTAIAIVEGFFTASTLVIRRRLAARFSVEDG